MPDVYLRNQNLREAMNKQNEQLEKAQLVAEKARNQ